jgi:hypothetical protein
MTQKQTAVEWLVEYYYDSEGKLTRQDFEQALAMEKEQIVEAHGKKVSRTLVQGTDLYGIRTGEQYYQETFRGVDD